MWLKFVFKLKSERFCNNGYPPNPLDATPTFASHFNLNFEQLHQGYLNGVRLLGAFSNLIVNEECTWCMEGLFLFMKYVIGA